ncbi:MAG: hypothetical protein LQ343_004489 [Gyalolechia ehrenbergii]|nr:MAG: hypothetical protein LQ343_004489 [Gyalolechia ehrenbergii]
MGDFIKGLLFGGSKPAPSPAPSAEDDFADFASAPSPSPIYSSDFSSSAPTAASFDDHSTLPTPIPYTKWYRVWERTSPSDFKAEAFIIPFIVLLATLHIWGRRKNKRKANAWAAAHFPALEREFASVGYGKSVKQQLNRGSTSEDVPGKEDEEGMTLKEKTAQEYTTYASGRQNVAFAEVKVKLLKRYNPMSLAAETALSFFFESFKTPREVVEITLHAFDGKEKDLVPVKSKAELDAKESRFKGLQNSGYDACVWAVVHKEQMKRLRDERYDVSLTATKDHKSLPLWASVMSESAEVTEALLTKELVDAVEKAGEEAFEYLIVTDQPVDKPMKLNEAAPHKRLILSLRLPSSTSASAYSSTLPLFEYFLHLPDLLVSAAHFRPEVTRKIRTTREEETKKLKKADEGEKAEERRLEAEKRKKEMRDTRLKGLSAEEQRKFLEKEREKGQKKQEKKMSRKA